MAVRITAWNIEHFSDAKFFNYGGRDERGLIGRSLVQTIHDIQPDLVIIIEAVDRRYYERPAGQPSDNDDDLFDSTRQFNATTTWADEAVQFGPVGKLAGPATYRAMQTLQSRLNGLAIEHGHDRSYRIVPCRNIGNFETVGLLYNRKKLVFRGPEVRTSTPGTVSLCPTKILPEGQFDWGQPAPRREDRGRILESKMADADYPFPWNNSSLCLPETQLSSPMSIKLDANTPVTVQPRVNQLEPAVIEIEPKRKRLCRALFREKGGDPLDVFAIHGPRARLRNNVFSYTRPIRYATEVAETIKALRQLSASGPWSRSRYVVLGDFNIAAGSFPAAAFEDSSIGINSSNQATVFTMMKTPAEATYITPGNRFTYVDQSALDNVVTIPATAGKDFRVIDPVQQNEAMQLPLNSLVQIAQRYGADRGARAFRDISNYGHIGKGAGSDHMPLFIEI